MATGARLVHGIGVKQRLLVLALMHTGTRINSLRRWCGEEESPGIDETPEWTDWSERATTADQERIEDVLRSLDVSGRNILHIGIGNSSLATKFSHSASHIDGITLRENEIIVAKSLHLGNYRVRLLNKYAPNLCREMGETYDFIVDNNPSTFCCCRVHFAYMLANYRSMLKRGGVILTDTVGLGWTSQPNDARWQLQKREWEAIGSVIGLKSLSYTENVIGLQEARPWWLTGLLRRPRSGLGETSHTNSSTKD